MSRTVSDKPLVIERLFRNRWDETAQTLSNPLVTFRDLQEAIDAHNADHADRILSTRNPANFFKDFVRYRRSANRNWPAHVLQCGYTARPAVGGGNSFEFVRLDSGQAEPFPVIASLEPKESTPRHVIESVSLPITSRRLGRSDESWLIQVLVRLRVLETHFAIYSPNKIVQLDHLQIGVKLHKSEIDALFLALADNSDAAEVDDENRGAEAVPRLSEIIVTCEAKGLRDDILLPQVNGQLGAVFTQAAITQNVAIAVAVKAIGPSQVYLIEFEAVRREQTHLLAEMELAVASEAVYEFAPHVPGIGR
jgi:hypothetical protein